MPLRFASTIRFVSAAVFTEHALNMGLASVGNPGFMIARPDQFAATSNAYTDSAGVCFVASLTNANPDASVVVDHLAETLLQPVFPDALCTGNAPNKNAMAHLHPSNDAYAEQVIGKIKGVSQVLKQADRPLNGLIIGGSLERPQHKGEKLRVHPFFRLLKQHITPQVEGLSYFVGRRVLQKPLNNHYVGVLYDGASNTWLIRLANDKTVREHQELTADDIAQSFAKIHIQPGDRVLTTQNQDITEAIRTAARKLGHYDA